MTPLNDTLRHIARQLGDQTYYTPINVYLSLGIVDDNDNLFANPPFK